MKKTLLFALILSFGALHAQDILITDSAGTVWNNDTIPYEEIMTAGDASNSGFNIKFEKAYITNNSNKLLRIKVERVTTNYPSGINDQICWGGICENPEPIFNSVRVSKEYEDMSPQQVIAGGGLGFAGYYLPGGNYGTVYFTYTFFDVNQEVPSSSFVVAFNAKKSVGIKEEKGLGKFSLSPNPANDYFDLTGLKQNVVAGTTVEILNIVGKVVSEKPINNPSEFERIDISELRAGIYFVRVKTENQISETQKLIIR